MTDAPFGVRQKASDLLVDGRPVRPEAFGDTGWPIVETAVLGEPNLRGELPVALQHGRVGGSPVGGDVAEDPGSEESKVWFLVAMPAIS